MLGMYKTAAYRTKCDEFCKGFIIIGMVCGNQLGG